MKKHASGMTLLEVVLVLTIGAAVILFSLSQYNRFRLDNDVLQLQYNVDELFQAAAKYYQANCAKGGTLDPANISTNSKSISVATDLINGGFLTSTFPAANPLINSTGFENGYAVQFNKALIPRTQTVCANPPTCSSTTTTQIGTVVIWRIQVSLAMLSTDPTKLKNYQNYLLANCLSGASSTSGATVAPCASNIPGNYIVFERLPSYATSDWYSQSTFWLSYPLMKQFNQMYTTNPINDLTSQSHTPEYQYYYCNG